MENHSVSSSQLKSTLSRTFLVGLVALLPLVLTAAAIGWLAGLLQQFLGPESVIGGMLIALGISFIDSRDLAFVVGVLLVVLLVYLLGLLLQWGLAGRLHGFINNLVLRIPVIGSIYDLASRLVGLFGAKDDPTMQSMVPAWCFFGGAGGTAVLGLLPSQTAVEINGFEYLAILVPSAPVPVGGGLLFVPKDWIKPADFGVEGLTSIYVTMGVSTPSVLGGSN
jgi:uncharacterized membrane protein